MKYFITLTLLLLSLFVHAQLVDDFSDGNFTSDPVWSGSNSGNDFTVVNNQLRSNLGVANSNFYLSTVNTIALNASWEFWVNLQFATSGANYTDIYLISDKADLQNSLINGYFVRIGNTDDEISLYKRSGTLVSSVKIIDGLNGSVSSSTNNSIKIRVKRDNNGIFTLDREIVSTGSSYFTEGTATDISHNTSAYFGIYVQQSTASFFNKHFFDNFKIEPVITDLLPPLLTSVVAIDSNKAELTFNEPMDSLSVRLVSNYSINNGAHAGVITTTPDPAKFILKFVSNLNTADYTVVITNVKDRNGNIIGTGNTAGFSYVKPYIAKTGDLIINEIFADPAPQIDLPSVEFAEIYNSSGQTLSLKNWKFADPSSSANLGEITIAPNSYLILCAKADTAEYKKFGQVLGLSPWPSLNNSSDVVKLINPSNTVIDSVAYSESWYRTTAKKAGGWTLERIDPISRCSGLFNWSASIDNSGGTPGRKNSIYSKDYDLLSLTADSIKLTSDTTLKLFFNKHLDVSTILADKFFLNPATAAVKKIIADPDCQELTITLNAKLLPATQYQISFSNLRDCGGTVISSASNKLSFKTNALPVPASARTDKGVLMITEILADPAPEVGLPLSEFIEIHNITKDTIDLDGWSINDPASKAIFRNKIILPNEYMILCAIADTILYKPFGKTIGLNPWLSLNNNSDQIVLKSFKNRLVDSVAYSDTWYKNPVKKSGGWSMERTDLSANTCNGFYNWFASTDATGGTPGRTNSISRPGFLSESIKIDSVSYTSDSTIVLSISSLPDTSILKPSHFSINNGIGNAGTIKLEYNPAKIFLSFNSKFQEGNEYSVTADSLFNCSATLTSSPNNQISFKIPAVPEMEYPLVINEIFADPSPVIGLPESEFVELFNPTDKAIPLQGLSYGDESSAYKFTSGEISAGSYLILCSAKDTLNFSSYGKIIGLPAWPSLNNEADILILKNNKGREIQRLAYSSSWYRDAEKKKGGFSLEMIDAGSLCAGNQNWTASKDAMGGTPGRQNSVHDTSLPEPIKLVEAVMKDSISLLLRFNKNIDSLSAATLQNFSVNNGVGTPVSARPLPPEFNQVLLTFKEPPGRGHTYQVATQNIRDCKGNLILPEFSSAQFILTEKIKAADILITEILFNPRPNGVDFIEIYNNTKHQRDLQELELAFVQKDTIGSRKALSTVQLLLEPEQYLVMTTDPDNIRKEYRTENHFLKLSSLPAFNDDAGTVVLVNKATKIDQFNYTEKMHFQLLKNFEGVSLERSSLSRPANEAGNFRSAAASAGFATPGYKNSQQSVDNNTINDEISLASKTFSPDNDGYEDLLQVNYHMEQPGMIATVTIYNDKGIPIKKLLKNFTLGSEGIFTWDGLNEFDAFPGIGIYFLSAELFRIDGTVKKFTRAFALAVKL
jgi:hypothetical protein